MRKLLAVLVMAGELATGISSGQQKGQQEVALQAAIRKETVEGDRKGAIEAYKKLVKGSNRAVAAQALVRLGQCYENLGDAEARNSYERVIREFGDQNDAVREARTRLAGLNQRAPANDGIAVQQVWVLPKEYGTGMFSADGRYSPYLDFGNGGALAIDDLASGENRLLTIKSGPRSDGAVSPVISGDGKQVAYAWENNGVYEIRSINIDGSGMRVLLSDKNLDPKPAAWSPDNKQVLFLSMKKDDWKIGLVSVADRSVHILKATSTGLGFPGGFSPDGRFIVYPRRNNSEQPSWSYTDFILAVDGSREVPIKEGWGSGQPPLWTPDGGRLVFLSDRSGSTGLWSIRVGDGRPVGEPVLLKADMGMIAGMRFAGDGALYYFTSGLQTDIFGAELDPGTGKLTSQPKPIVDRFIGSNQGPVAWSPDGRFLAFIRRPTTMNFGARPTIVIRSDANGEERELPDQILGAPVLLQDIWFPDGRSLLVPVPPRSGKEWELRQIDARTGETQSSFSVPPLDYWTYSRDRKALYYSRRDGAVPCEGGVCTFAMIRRVIATGQETELFRMKTPGDGFFSPSLSPDEKQIAFLVSTGESEYTLVAIPVAGGAPRELYHCPKNLSIGLQHALAWTNDGRHLLALGNQSGRPMLWSFAVEGGEPQASSLAPITSFARPPSISVHPDSKRIAISGGQNRQELWVMRGLLREAGRSR